MDVSFKAARMGSEAIDVAETYRRDGFVFPIDVLSVAEAQAIRADLEAAEAELANDPERLGLLRSSTNHLLPSFDALVRNQTLLAAASEVLGPDLIVWSVTCSSRKRTRPRSCPVTRT